MFKRDVQQIKDIILRNLRAQGLETPLLQRRLIASWPDVAGDMTASHTLDVWIKNQTLFVKMDSPALRANLSMQRQTLVTQLNEHVGSQVIADIRFC